FRMNKEGEDVRLQNKMVENIKAQPVDSIILLTNFMSECKRLGCISFYREKNDDKKIQFFIGGPEYNNGHEEEGILVGDLYRMKRKEDENMLDHIEQARSEVKEHDLVKTELLSIITAEMKEVIGDIKRFMMTNIEFINKNLELIKELEKECIDEVNRVKNMENLLEKLSKLKFTYNENLYKSEFYTLPKVKSQKKLIYRDTPMELNNLEKISYVCEIKTTEGLKKLESGIEIEIKKLMDNDYIQDLESTWVNNLRPVVKPDRIIRITTNLVSLNKFVEQDKCSLSRIDEILCNLSKKEVFSKIDLKDGLFQIPLAEKNRHKTAFRYKHKLYE
ncbi:hypothetical protein G9O61_00g022250, partial [Vairimorpha ceranae]